jgi:hypothetical protein
VVAQVLGQDAARVALAEDQHPVVSSARRVRIQRSA